MDMDDGVSVAGGTLLEVVGTQDTPEQRWRRLRRPCGVTRYLEGGEMPDYRDAGMRDSEKPDRRSRWVGELRFEDGGSCQAAEGDVGFSRGLLLFTSMNQRQVAALLANRRRVVPGAVGPGFAGHRLMCEFPDGTLLCSPAWYPQNSHRFLLRFVHPTHSNTTAYRGLLTYYGCSGPSQM